MEGAPRKKRRLLPLGDTFETPAPSDDPKLHHGRIRTVPHVEGQWSTHLYVELQASTTLLSSLRDLEKSATMELPEGSLHSLIESDQPLHLSLSRPLQLWSGQHEAFKKSIRSALSGISSFYVHLAALTTLTNDEGTRSFLCCEVGYGSEKLSEITQKINHVLEKEHLPVYYTEPRFHTSIAWWLPSDTAALSPETLVDLEKHHGKAIRKPSIRVERVHMKIGKSVSAFNLQ